MKRNKKGQFKKKRQGRIMATLVLLALVAIVTVSHFKPQQDSVEVPNEPDVDQIVEQRTQEAISSKITQLEDEVLDTLAKCETGGVEEPDGAILYDRAANNDVRRMSIGRYMFQRRTIQHYIKTFEGREISKAEAITIAITPELSTELARKIIFTTENGHKNWFNCSKKHDLPGKIDLINQLR